MSDLTLVTYFGGMLALLLVFTVAWAVNVKTSKEKLNLPFTGEWGTRHALMFTVVLLTPVLNWVGAVAVLIYIGYVLFCAHMEELEAKELS